MSDAPLQLFLNATGTVVTGASGPLASPIIQLAGWVGTTAVVVAVAAQAIRRGGDGRSAASSIVSVCRAFAVPMLVLAAAACVVVGVTRWAAPRTDLIGTIVHTGASVLAATAAYLTALFLARQLQAPPWWRFDTTSRSHVRDGFGLRDVGTWIWEDIADLLASLRGLDRVVVLVAVPLAGVHLLGSLGTARALSLVLAAELVAVLGLAAAVVAADRIPATLLRRLHELRGVTRRIAAGDLSARAAHADGDDYADIAALITDVNAMARTLAAREEQHRHHYEHLSSTLIAEQERSSRDGLTGLRNLRYFQEALAAELYRCSRTGELVTIGIVDLDDFKAVNDTHGHQEGDAVLVRTAQAFALALRPYDLPARLGGEEFGVIFPSTTPEEAKMVLDRIMDELRGAGPNGVAQTFSGGIATFPTHATDQTRLYELADSSSYAAKLNGKAHTVVFDPERMQNVAEGDRVNTRELEAQLRAARTLVQTVDTIEGFGNQHSENVGRISSRVALELGHDDEFARQMYMCGLLHDVGKLGLDQDVVQKAGQLTAAEFEEVKRHPELSAKIVANAGLGDIATWVHHHHEHWDGSGYPHRLSGRDIPLGSRIVLVAEAFDVMTSDRSYRRAMRVDEALAELMSGAGSRFDPDVVGALVTLARNGALEAAGAGPRGGGMLGDGMERVA